jgi:hypothetical protein
MELNNDIVFQVMVTFPDLLKKKIEDYNQRYKTDFQLIEVIDDEVPFCKIKATKYVPSDIFNLGYSLAALQYNLKEKGELDW